MDFDLWLFSLKHLSHSPMTAKTVYDNMPVSEKHELDLEYIDSQWCLWNEALIASIKGEKKKEPKMGFDLWLYAMKRLSQTMDSACVVFEHMPEAEKADLRKEYDAWVNS